MRVVFPYNCVVVGEPTIQAFTTYLPFDTILVYENGVKTFEGSPARFTLKFGVWVPDPLGIIPLVIEIRVTLPPSASSAHCR